jgi:hypothetical protein
MDDDMEDYGFEYSDDDTEQEDVDIENQYYNSKGAPKTFVPVTTIYYFLSAAGMLENGNVVHSLPAPGVVRWDDE